jgi:hypothetical protein
MSVKGLGKCAICHRQINEMTPINSVMLGRPQRAYLCHKECKTQEPPRVGYTVDGRGELQPPHPEPQPSDEVKIVTSLGDFMPQISAPEAPEPTPVKEQKGRPAKKAAPAKKAPAKATTTTTTTEAGTP